MTDEVDDIFDMMDRVFGRTPRHSYRREPSKKHISPDRYERKIDDDNIYYTFELREFNKEDVSVEYVKSKSSLDEYGTVKITLSDKNYDPLKLKLPYPIKSKSMKVTFINGILDITCPIHKEMIEKATIE